MTSTLKVLLVINPISGGINKDQKISALKNKFKEFQISFTEYLTTGNDDTENIRALINEQTPNRILVLGGDGTIKMVAEAVHSEEIAVGIIPAGSSNGLAHSLGIPDDLETQLEVALGDHIIAVDKIKINDEICLHIADLGINAELIRNYENSNVRGKLGYLMQSIPTIFSCDYPFEFTIELNNQTIKKTGILLVIANARKYGTGATVNPSGKINDRTFELLIYKKLDLVEIIKTLREKVEMNPEFVECYPANSACIRCAEKVPFQIDGEFIAEVSELKVELSSEQLKLACPFQFKS